MHAWRRIESLATLSIFGRDAVAYAQSQFANDLRPLADRSWQWNCLLNAQGRVLALLILLRIDAEHLAAIVPASAAETLRAHLARYVLRSKVALAIDPVAPAGRTGAPSTALAAGGWIEAEGAGWRIRIGGRHAREFAIGVPGSASFDAAAWRRADIDDALPWLEADAVAAHVPHALGLGALPAFSTNKGCYPGQEIVARTHFLGRNKRRLAQFRGNVGTLPAPGTRLLAPEAPGADALGHVVTAARDAGGGTVGLAVVRDDAPPHARMDGTDATAILTLASAAPAASPTG